MQRAETVKEYRFKPAEEAAGGQGIAAYKPLVNSTVRVRRTYGQDGRRLCLRTTDSKPGQEWSAPGGRNSRSSWC